MTNVLCDFHHGSLYYSMYLLFEKRLKWNLFRPIGYEWYRKGFWNYSRNPATVKQYLEVPRHIKEKATYIYRATAEENGIYHIEIEEGTDKYIQKAITLERFSKMDFDFIIASVAQNEAPFYRLAQKYQPNAVLIRQMGNPYETCHFEWFRNVMNSTTNPVPDSVNVVTYHPEFNLKDYCYTEPTIHKTIKSFQNCLPREKDVHLWYEYERLLSDFTFKMHGILGRDGLLLNRDVPSSMRETGFIWNTKSVGDGYGFVVHQACAIGRPLIIKKSYYYGKMAEPLLEDSVTCINLDKGTVKENVEKIRYWAEPERHKQMCRNTYNRFRELVNFDKEFEEIKKFLERAKKGE